ncbi:proton channel OtopLc-like [Branchiostoma floridae]|uniref:Proton channel OtopLc-like n=1 Tax=Branchiostoma floridae TaxID=7739 RepID=A0A9J7HV56_BRAFL|nr:proton channel OtopLc-like [Branchiostoma floridae]
MPAMLDAPLKPYQHHNARRVEPRPIEQLQKSRISTRPQQNLQDQDMMFERNKSVYSRSQHVIPTANGMVERNKTYARYQRENPVQDMAERASQASSVCSDKELFASRRSSVVSSRRSSVSEEYCGQVEEDREPTPNQNTFPNGTLVTEEDGAGGVEDTDSPSDDKWMLLRMFGVLYGLLMFAVGTMLPAAQLFSSDISQATVEAFYLYLFLVGALWMGAVHACSIMAARGGRTVDKPDSTVNTYLTGAASFFGFCTILISAFKFGTYVYSDANDDSGGACENILLAVTPVCEAVFTLLLVHHLWHHAWSNRTRRGKLHVLTSFGVMHTVATCGCAWIRTVIIEAWIDVKRLTPDDTPSLAPSTDVPAAFGVSNCSFNGSGLPVESVTTFALNTSSATPAAVVRRSVEDEVEVFNITETTNAANMSEASMDCLRERAFLTTLDPLLYPSNVEFYILSVGLILILWSKMAEANEVVSPPRRWSMEKSNGGTVLSFLLFVVTICVIVLYHNDPSPGSAAFVVYYAHRIVLLLTMTIACVFTCVRRRRAVEKGGWTLDPERDNRLGMIIILLCVTTIYFRDLLTAVAAIFLNQPELIPGIVLMEALLDVVLVTTQSAVVLDTLSRIPPTAEFCPDLTRQAVVFLVLCNASLFVICTNDANDHGTDLVQIEYFGVIMWSVLRNIVQPFVIFHRFYCSVSFMEVWLRG